MAQTGDDQSDANQDKKTSSAVAKVKKNKLKIKKEAPTASRSGIATKQRAEMPGQKVLFIFGGGMGCNLGKKAAVLYARGSFFIGCSNYQHKIQDKPGKIDHVNFLFLNPDRSHLIMTIEDTLEQIFREALADIAADKLVPDALKTRIGELLKKLDSSNDDKDNEQSKTVTLESFLARIAGGPGVSNTIPKLPQAIRQLAKERLSVQNNIFWKAYSGDGYGAGSDPIRGWQMLKDAEESILKLEEFYPSNIKAERIPEVHRIFSEADHIITTAGMGGGAGMPVPLEIGFMLDKLIKEKKVKADVTHIAMGTKPFDWDIRRKTLAEKFIDEHYRLRPVDSKRNLVCQLSSSIILYSNSKLVSQFIQPDMEIGEALEGMANVEMLKCIRALLCILGVTAVMNIDPRDVINSLGQTSQLWLYSVEIPYTGAAPTEDEIKNIPAIMNEGFRAETPADVRDVMLLVEYSKLTRAQCSAVIEKVIESLDAKEMGTKIALLPVVPPTDSETTADETKKNVIKIYAIGFSGGGLTTAHMDDEEDKGGAPDSLLEILTDDPTKAAAITAGGSGPAEAAVDAASEPPAAPAPGAPPAEKKPASGKDELEIPAFLRTPPPPGQGQG